MPSANLSVQPERGGMLLETIFGVALMASALLSFYQHYQIRAESRAIVAVAQAQETLARHIKVRAIAGVAAQLLERGETRHFAGEDLRDLGLLGAHRAAEGITLHLTRHEDDRLTLRLLAGGEELHRTAARMMTPIHLPTEIPETLARAWHLEGADAWWLDPAYMPVTRNIAQKIKAGWQLEPVLAGGQLRETLPQCSEGEPFIMAMPESAFRAGLVPGEEPLMLHEKTGEHLFANVYSGTGGGAPHSREVIISAMTTRKAWPFAIERAGELPYMPQAAMMGDTPLWHGWAIEGSLDIHHESSLSPPGHWSVAHQQTKLITANRAFSVLHGSMRIKEEHGGIDAWVHLGYRLAQGEAGALDTIPAFDAAINPHWYKRGAGETEANRRTAGLTRHWGSTEHTPHITVAMAVPQTEVLAAQREFSEQDKLIASFTHGADGEQIPYHHFQGTQSERRELFQSMYDRLRPHALELREAAGAMKDNALPSGANALLVAGEAIHHAGVDGIVQFPSPAQAIPQSLNLNELLMDCDSTGHCVPLGESGIHEVGRNDPEDETGFRPHGILHFGKVNIHHPREEVHLLKACL